MTLTLTLASSSRIRRILLENANLRVEVKPAQVDEEAIRQALQAERASPRDIADTLAEQKSLRISRKVPGALVLGCDQVLDLDGRILSKPQSPDDARNQLADLRGRRHDLLSAAVICRDGEPIWRYVGVAHMTMRDLSDAWINAYVDRNWPTICESVGAYQLESEGVRLFSRVEGDYFTILGLPLLDLLSFLIGRGDLPT
ncbi:Maf-like protein YceF [Roseovarius sp. A-2]|uniref:Maf family protein n=1 Tax=Roseovarius sp. A-2 TaxID=1570360 RepID=UPI0009B505A3|nr:Maf family protein [Roseovarius sp. A-2]GAW36342.1 Maf-like protein YceF [Roseovarius sp. A-2]